MSHAHDHSNGGNRRRLLASLCLAASYMAAEVLGGLYTGSLALLADAGHMLSDVAALSLALGAMWLSTRPAPVQRTFGNHRAEVLAALANAVALGAIGIFVIVEAVERFASPPDVLAGPMLLIATGGLLVNIVALLILRGGQSENLNVRGAFLHVLADALGSIGAMVSGILIWAFDWRWADPAASFVIACLVLVSAWVLLKQTVAVLMQSSPKGLDVAEVERALLRDNDVKELHDLHVWTLSSGKEALSGHVVLDDLQSWPEALGRTRRQLHRQFGIDHVTLQAELQDGGDCGCAFA